MDSMYPFDFENLHMAHPFTVQFSLKYPFCEKRLIIVFRMQHIHLVQIVKSPMIWVSVNVNPEFHINPPKNHSMTQTYSASYTTMEFSLPLRHTLFVLSFFFTGSSCFTSLELNSSSSPFPDNFLFGTASSSYQVY